MLYPKGGCTIHVASRSTDRIAAAIEEIKTTALAPPQGKPTWLKSLLLDLDDLTIVPRSTNQCLAQESHLDILWNSAGVAQANIGSTIKKGYEAHMGINCLVLYLFILCEQKLGAFTELWQGWPRKSLVQMVENRASDVIHE